MLPYNLLINLNLGSPTADHCTIIIFLTFPRLSTHPLFQGYAITRELLEYQALAGDGLERGSLLVRSYLVPDTWPEREPPLHPDLSLLNRFAYTKLLLGL